MYPCVPTKDICAKDLFALLYSITVCVNYWWAFIYFRFHFEVFTYDGRNRFQTINFSEVVQHQVLAHNNLPLYNAYF